MAELNLWNNSMDLDDVGHPGMDLDAELSFGPEHDLGLEAMGPLPTLGDSLGAELGGNDLGSELQGDTLGDELGGSLGGELGKSLDGELGGSLGEELLDSRDPTTLAVDPGPEGRKRVPSHTSLSTELDLDAPPQDSLAPPAAQSTDPQADFEARLQATHGQTLAQLNSTIHHTDLFLAKLRPAASVEEDIQKLEATAARVVRQLQDTAIEREAQVRELKEAQLVLDMFDPPTSQLPSITASESGAEVAAAAAGPHWVPRSTTAPEEYLDQDDQLVESKLLLDGRDGEDPLGLHSDAQEPSTRRAVLRSDQPETVRGSVGAGMAAVRSMTSDLLTELAAMNEHTQVHRAAFNDLGRKVRGLKGAMTQIASETNSTQQSIDWLTHWHARQRTDYSIPPSTATSTDTATAPTDSHAGLKAWIDSVRTYMDRALSDAHTQAATLLQPLPLPPSLAEIDLSKVELPVSSTVAGQA